MGIKKILKEYYGPAPIIGGTMVAGVAGIIAYSVGAIKNLPDNILYVINTGDLVGGIFSLYEKAGNVCGKYVVPGFVAGQFLFYKFGKMLKNVFKGR